MVAKEVARANLAFCCLQEVKYRNSGKKLINLDSGEKFEFHWCGMKKRREAGVGILIRVDNKIVINDADFQTPRIMSFDLKIHGFNIRLVNVYAPTDCGGTVSSKDEFYRSLRKACKTNEKHQKLIVAGDFNAKTKVALSKCDYDSTTTMFDDDCNDNGIRLKNFCRANKLGIASTYFEYPLENRYTWYSCDKVTKRVNDYVLTERFVQQYITDCIAMPEYDFDSDHRILITKLKTPCTRRSRWRKKGKPHSKPDVKSIKETEIRKNFKQYVQINLNKAKGTDTSEKSQQIVGLLSEAASLELKSVTRRKCTETWKNDDKLNAFLKERQSIEQKSETYKALTKKIKTRVKFLRNERLSLEANAINENATRRDVEELYRRMKSCDSAFRTINQSKKCDPSNLKKHFYRHFNRETNAADPIEITEAPNFITALQNVPENVMKTNAPDKDELHATIKKLKKGRSSNDIPTEYIQAASEINGFLEEMEKLYCTIWETLAIPTSWGHSKLVSIWKGSAKGKSSDPNAYRGLQVGSSMCKIMIVIILNRIKDWYDKQLLDQQQGFRSGRGTTDGIFITKRIQQVADKMKKPVYLLFVDLSAAFDHIERNWLFKSIKTRFAADQDTKLINLLEMLYKHTTTSLAENPDDEFDISLGVRQGGPESPMLYNMYMDFVMRVFMESCKETHIKFLNLRYCIPHFASKNSRTLIGYHRIDWIGYADDLVLAFEDKESLQNALNLLDETFLRFSLAINVSKTKSMIINHQILEVEYPKSIAKLNGTDVENVEIFRYLGCNIKYNEPGVGDSELEFRIECAECKFYELSKKFMNHKIAIATRVKIFNALVRTRLTYSCQAWSLTQRQLQRVSSSYMSMLRKMVKDGYRRHKNAWNLILTNEDLLRICRTESIEMYVCAQQRRYLAHVIRGENVQISKRLLYNNNEPKKCGRRSTLMSTVLHNESTNEEVFCKRAIERRY